MARVPRGRGRVGGRGGRTGGRGGRGRGQSRVTTSFEWVTQSESSEQETDLPMYQEDSVGYVSVSDSTVGAGGSIGATGVAKGPGAGIATGGVPDPEDRLAKMLALILERLPVTVPAHAPVMTPREQYLSMYDQMLGMGPLSFSGGGGPEAANEWRLRVERRLRSVRCPEEYRVDLAVGFLEGDAYLWWTGVQARRRRTVWTWGEFLGEFNAKFFPQEVVDQLELQFRRLVQGNRSVREYDAEFSRLVVYASSGMDEERAQMGKFVGGLRLGLRKPSRASKYASRAELVEALAAIEDLREQVED